MRNLPYTPFRLEPLIASAWFTHTNPAVVRAGLFLIDAAWRSDPVGELPADIVSLAMHARLTAQDMQQNYAALTDGWVLEGQKLVNPDLRRLGQSVSERFGDELDVMAESAVVAMQGSQGDLDLFAPSAIKARKGGKVAIKTLEPDAESLAALQAHGYTSNEAKLWALRRFEDFAVARNERKTPAQWQAAFRNYIGTAFTLRDFRASEVAATCQPVAAKKVGFVGPVTGAAALRLAIDGAPRSFQDRLRDSNSMAAMAALQQAALTPTDTPGM